MVAGLIGWFTKLVAIRMMFWPFKFRGSTVRAGSGIIPRRVPQMIEVLCETLTGRLISAAEIVGRVDSKKLARRMERPLRRKLVRIVLAAAPPEWQPTTWGGPHRLLERPVVA